MLSAHIANVFTIAYSSLGSRSCLRQVESHTCHCQICDCYQHMSKGQQCELMHVTRKPVIVPQYVSIVYCMCWQTGEMTMNPFSRSSFTQDLACHGLHGASRRHRLPQGNAMHMEISIVKAVTVASYCAMPCRIVPELV